MKLLKECWLTALEIKETLGDFKEMSRGKESFPLNLESEDFDWPFPMVKPEEAKNES